MEEKIMSAHEPTRLGKLLSLLLLVSLPAFLFWCL